MTAQVRPGLLMDRTVQLMRTGYPWAAELRGGADAVPTRLLGRPAVVVGGPAGVRRFYDPGLRRRAAFPPPIKLVLFGQGALHGLDDGAHHARKAMFVDVLTPPAVHDLAARAGVEWSAAARGWDDPGEVEVFAEAAWVLTRAVLPWAGIPVDGDEPAVRGRQLVEVVDGFATPVVPYCRALVSRRRLNRWAAGLVQQVRDGALQPAPGSALHAAATFRDPRGRWLPARVAGVELLNFVRPTVAVAWYIAFAADALAAHPEWRSRIADGDQRAVSAVAQEVRRLYPFVPVLAARARHRQDVLGFPVRRGGLVVLDVHGTNHDPAYWPDPDRFDPDRFLSGTVVPDALVPQGGGDVRLGHRCPGEDVTLAMLMVALRHLAPRPDVVEAQDLHWDLSRMPSRPVSGICTARLRERTAAEPADPQPAGSS